MKLPKNKQQIVDAAHPGVDEAKNLLEKAKKTGQESLESLEQATEQGGILANLAQMARLKKKALSPEELGVHMPPKDMPTPLRIAVLGGGSFGTAMANIATKNGCQVTMWVRDKSVVRSLQKTYINKKYLPNHKLDKRLKFSHDLAESVQNKDIILVVVPSSAVRETLRNIAPYITHQAVISLTKGIEKQSFALMSEIIQEELPHVNFGVLSVPNLAAEIMDNMPSATVIASHSEPLRTAVQTALHSAFFRVFASDDVKGVELGGALKNIYAVAMGMANAYHVGDNTKAMLLTRALAEMSRFGVAVGANPLTFLGLSGVGDLYATCNSTLSRNYQIGNMLGKGIALEDAIKKLGQTAEGVNTIKEVHEKASELGVYMPITHALYAVLYENKAALGVALNLMETGFRSDVEFVMPHDESNAKLSAEFGKVLQNSKERRNKAFETDKTDNEQDQTPKD